MVGECAEWSSWADWSECYQIPTLFQSVNCNYPKYRLREKRRCKEAKSFCVKNEQEICSCLELDPSVPSNATTSGSYTPHGLQQRPAMSTATVIGNWYHITIYYGVIFQHLFALEY